MRSLEKIFIYNLKICLLVLVCFAIATCKKVNNRKIKVSGILWEYCGEAPASNVTVNLYAGKTSAWNSSYTLDLIGTSSTNNDGVFDFGEIDVDKRINYFYKILHTLSSNDNISRGPGTGSPFHVKNTDAIYINDSNKEQIIKNGFYTDTLRFCGFATNVKLFLSSVPPYSLDDTINVSITGNYGNAILDRWHRLNFVKEDGKVIEGRVEAGNYKVRVYKKRNNISSEYFDTWKITWNKNATYTINF